MANDEWGFGSNDSSFGNTSSDFSLPDSQNNKNNGNGSGQEWSQFNVQQQAAPQNGAKNLHSGFQPEAIKAELVKGPWYWPLTILSLIVVGLFSFGMVYLTKDIRERNVWLIGLHFMVPLAAMMLSALFLEHSTSAMTPNASRTKQLLVAISAIVLTFVVGCVSDLIYLQGFVKKMPIVPQSKASSNNVIFLMDKSGSMGGKSDEESQKAVKDILDTMPDDACVGIVLFCDYILETEPLQPLTSAHRNKIKQTLARPTTGLTDFDNPFSTALNMYAQTLPQNGYKNTIIMIMDGQEPVRYADDYAKQAKQLGLSISTISVNGTNIKNDMTQLVSQTGGIAYSSRNYNDLKAQIHKIAEVQTITVEIEDRDLLRSTHPTAVVISGIMLLLEGIVLGLCLWLMFSVHGQFRAQAIISPLLAVGAFVLVKLGPYLEWYSYSWIIEGAAFTLLGIVFMRQNRHLKPTKPTTDNNAQQASSFDINFF